MSHDVAGSFDPQALQRICAMPERAFGPAFGMTRTAVPQSSPSDFYFYRDNGADVLAVAHLDTVAPANSRAANFIDTQAGPVVYSRALDDRLGAYTILDLLPKFDVSCDWLFTVGEEMGQSTAAFFEPTKEYDWVIEFDRGGTDVVMYQFDDCATRELVEASGATVGEGIFSDICYLDHLSVKAFNWGIGYRDYHGPRAHAYLDDTFRMVGQFLDFYGANVGRAMPHVARSRSRYWWDDETTDGDECRMCLAASTPDNGDGYCSECGACLDCGEFAGVCQCLIIRRA